MWQLDWSKLAEVLTYNAKQPMIFSSGLFLFLFLEPTGQPVRGDVPYTGPIR